MYTTLIMVVVEAYTELMTVVYGGRGGIDSIDSGEDIYSSNGGGGNMYSIDGGGGGKGDIHAQFSFAKYVSCEQTR